MFPAPLILILLIIATPVIVIFDGPITHGLITLVVALSVAIIALRIRTGEAGFLSSVFSAAAIVSAIPALWMLVQILPLKAVGLANPIWESATVALGRLPGGSISIDPGATLIALVQYLSMVAVALVAAAVAIDRHRAQGLLFVLTASATLIALMFLATSLGIFTFPNSAQVTAIGNVATVCAVLGVILGSTGVFHTVERWQARANRREPAVWVRLIFAGYFGAIALCFLALTTTATSQTYFALLCGIATLIIVIAIRHFHLGPWGYAAIVAIASVVAIAVVTFQPAVQTLGLMLAFTSQAPRPLVTLTQRILAETSWTGTGAGTFAALLPIYRDLNEMATGTVAPNALAAIAIEMGRPFLMASLAAAIALIIIFLHGAVRRGRDLFYSTAGASCSVTITLLAFGNAALFNTAVTIIAAAVVGMALAQSKSRSV